MAHLHPVIAEFGNHVALTEPARELLGLDAVSLYTEKLNTKRSGVGGAFALHRDLPYWVGSSDDPERMLTALVALDDATVDNGALQVLPGSHLVDDLPFKESELEFERNEIDPDRMDTSAHDRRGVTGRERRLLRCPSGAHVGVESVGPRPPSDAVHLPTPRPAATCATSIREWFADG